MPFTGFRPKSRFTPIPAQFFAELLPEIDHLGEMKITLYTLWFLSQLEGNVRYIFFRDYLADQRLMASLSTTPDDGYANLVDALERATQRGTLLRACAPGGELVDSIYFLNSPRGLAAAETLGKGEWSPEQNGRPDVALELERPNIFRLYEENIGPLTTMIAEDLRAAEQTYPPEWIEDAIHLAVNNNVRRWHYVSAVLRAWQEKGRNDANRGDSAEDRRRYVEGKYSDYIEH
jgi:DnaD/phage-associated family protein